MADQVHRIVYMLKKFQSGHKYTTAELFEICKKEFGDVSLRTIQRDMLLLSECEPALTSVRASKENVWYIPREVRNAQAVSRLNTYDMVSIYNLKAHLKSFRGTVIEDDAIKLADKIDRIAPSDVFSPQTFLWDQNIGVFDYSAKEKIVANIVRAIAEKIWVRVKYIPNNKTKIHEITVMLRCCFNFNGGLYCVAFIPKHESHIALSLQNIEGVDFMEKFNHKVTDFDFLDWTRNRFGVFYGEMKKVTIQVRKEYRNDFINRKWHHSQTIEETPDGDLILEMRIPIGIDFISWVLSWHEAIVVKKPAELVKQVNDVMHKVLANYDWNRMEDDQPLYL